VRVARGAAPHGLAHDGILIGAPGEDWGEALAFGDFDDDGYTDLVVGMPFSDLDRDALSGGVEVFFSALFAEDFEGEDLEE